MFHICRILECWKSTSSYPNYNSASTCNLESRHSNSVQYSLLFEPFSTSSSEDRKLVHLGGTTVWISFNAIFLPWISVNSSPILQFNRSQHFSLSSNPPAAVVKNRRIPSFSRSCGISSIAVRPRGVNPSKYKSTIVQDHSQVTIFHHHKRFISLLKHVFAFLLCSKCREWINLWMGMVFSAGAFGSVL